MKAIVKRKYGGPEILTLEDVEKPVVKEDSLLIRVKANSINPADWHILRGKPIIARLSFGLFKPKNIILGADFAGIVEEVGSNISHFKIGDLVFGETIGGGAFAEYTCAPGQVCGIFPKGLKFTEMASVPIAGITALQTLKTYGNLQQGESVLLNGASGGVGHFAVQIAKALGATVTGVCSSNNTDYVMGLGADAVIAYDKESIHKHMGKYDLIVDTHGNLFLEDFRRMGQRGVVVGFTTMHHILWLMIKASLSSFPLVQFTAKANTEDLEQLASLILEGKIKVHIDRIYPYSKIPEAISYIEAMRTRGKVAIDWEDNGEG